MLSGLRFEATHTFCTLGDVLFSDGADPTRILIVLTKPVASRLATMAVADRVTAPGYLKTSLSTRSQMVIFFSAGIYSDLAEIIDSFNMSILLKTISRLNITRRRICMDESKAVYPAVVWIR
ncbi:hypothetical protein CHS0354_040475 [Potamilus streckersoni]|uniref:Uncharacterized protein n=1 Tax=Potamilus streckersoni TaxID=2493646 RepID=A0AAE0WEL0_9BIVA|nr:hypothetical protein CHS0354_040475 [Potamilus streckersoni]